MARFSVPAESKKYSTVVEMFRGVDLNNSPANVDKSRSPEAPNMIRDQVGKVRKRTGYTTMVTAPEGAAHPRRTPAEGRDAGTRRKQAVPPAPDGGRHVEPDGHRQHGSRPQPGASSLTENCTCLTALPTASTTARRCHPVADKATVPVIIISRRPTGGGEAYQGLNLLGRKWTESFLGTADATVYQLTTAGLDSDAVTAEVLDANGTWVAKTEGTDFTVDRTAGKVTFKKAPGESPVTGQDNVHITAAKTREGYLDSINRCTVPAVYGVGGSTDRVFLTGNADKAGVDFYSEFENPAFFPDVNYTKIARDGGTIVGYAVLGSALAAFVSGSTDGRNVVVRTGDLDSDGSAVFRIINTVIGQDAVGAGQLLPDG